MINQFGYPVDIVLCIDATSSMTGIIEETKTSALNFHRDLQEAMAEKSKHLDTLRVKVIVFRDYYVDGDRSVEETNFFQLPSEDEDFTRFVKSIEAVGGGDEPENGLEALALAIASDWRRTGEKRRHVIVLFSDASTHPLEKNAGAKPVHYPADLPEDFDALTDLWEGQTMDRGAKRLILYAPDAQSWSDIGTHWENVLHYPSKAGRGLSEVDYSTILGAIANSV